MGYDFIYGNCHPYGILKISYTQYLNLIESKYGNGLQSVHTGIPGIELQ